MCNMLEAYCGAGVLLTGCTGFLGKVVLEKLLWSLPQAGKVYVLIRSKKGTDISERLRKEVLESACFDRLRAQRPDFAGFVDTHIQAISGDLMREDLGLSSHDVALLTTQVNIVIHSAGTVDFNNRLDQIVQMNALGTLRLLELSKTFHSVKSFLYVSSAYANSDKFGRIEEKLYPMKQDPNLTIKTIFKLSVEEIERMTPTIIGSFPNTYTFSKCLAEHLININRGNLPVVILRPSIIGSSWAEPMPGWVDTLSTCGAMYLLSGLGLFKVAQGNSSGIADIVPADLVANACITAAAKYVQTKELVVVHVGSSVLNPTTWGMAKDAMVAYWRKTPPEKAISSAELKTYANSLVYRTVSFVKRRLPYWFFKVYAYASQNPKNIKNALLYKQALDRELTIAALFRHFTCNEWMFSSQRILEIANSMTKEEKQTFPIDITSISWKGYFTLYTYGIHKWILKEKVEPPVDPENLDINLDSIRLKRFEDLFWAVNQPVSLRIRALSETKSLVLNSDNVQKAIRVFASTMKPGEGGDMEGNVRKATKMAEDMLTRMCGDLRPGMLRLFAYALRKIWRQIYEKIVIDQKAVQKLKRLQETRKGPIILAPTHRSYVDFLILSYILFAYNIRVPYIAAGEDFLQIAIVNHILRMSGAFFIKRRLQNAKLYSAILTEYMQRLLRDDQFVEFFVEGTRSRSGKTLPPKMGLLTMCTDLVYDKTISGLHVVPITINYERVLEGETFPFELLGEEKVKESLGRIIKAAKILNMNFGKIFVNFGDFIDVSEFTARHPHLNPYQKPSDRKAMNQLLGYEVVYSFQQNLVIMPTAMLAALLLTNRRGMGEDELIAQCNWLREQVEAHGYKLGGMRSGTSLASLRNALGHFGDNIVFRKEVFSQTVSVKQDYKSILLLGYYRNALSHIFYQEAFCICALNGFGERLAFTTGITKDRLHEEMLFLASLFKAEYVTRTPLLTLSDAEKVTNQLLSKGLLQANGSNYRLVKGKEAHVNFLCSLVWPLVDTFWTTTTFAFGLKYRSAVAVEKLIHGVQMFAENLYEERVISFYESCAMESIKNCIATLTSLGIFQKITTGDIKMLRISEDLNKDESRLQELLDHVGTFKKASFAKSLSSADELRKSLVTDYAMTGPKL